MKRQLAGSLTLTVAARAGTLDSNTPRRDCMAVAALLSKGASLGSSGHASRSQPNGALPSSCVMHSICSDARSRLERHPSKTYIGWQVGSRNAHLRRGAR